VIYQVRGNALRLVRTGTHSDLFEAWARRGSAHGDRQPTASHENVGL